MYAHRPRPAPLLGLTGMTSDLRNRLLLLLVLPLCVLALVGVWMDYRSADDAASYQKEAPRLCRGGSRSLTFQEVVHRRDFQS